jgi:hypothetical protein
MKPATLSIHGQLELSPLSEVSERLGNVEPLNLSEKAKSLKTLRLHKENNGTELA